MLIALKPMRVCSPYFHAYGGSGFFSRLYFNFTFTVSSLSTRVTDDTPRGSTISMTSEMNLFRAFMMTMYLSRRIHLCNEPTYYFPERGKFLSQETDHSETIRYCSLQYIKKVCEHGGGFEWDSAILMRRRFCW